MSDSALVIGLDAGTTSFKAIACNADGRVLADGREGLALFNPHPAWYEQPAEAWWVAAASALRQITAQVRGDQVTALCISHQRESFAPLDAEMQPLRNAIIWMDERSRKLLPVIEAKLGPEDFHQLTGRPLTGNLTVGKIAWLRVYEPEVYARAAYYADTHAYLAYRLTGRLRTGWGSADPTGLLDIRQHRWATQILDAIGIKDRQLPELFPPGAVIGYLTPEAAAQTGLPAGLPLVCGLGDGQAAGLGAKIIAPGPAYLNLGTAVVSGTYSDAYITDRAFRTTCGGIPGSYLLETVLLGGTYTVSWFAEKIAPDAGSDERSRLTVYDAAAENLPPGAEGLMLLPYWNTAMNPYWDAGGERRRDRLARTSRPATSIPRAILEGVAYELRLHTEGVEAATGAPITEFTAMGGGSRSALWRQIIADVTGKSIRLCAGAETGAMGAAILAAAGAGLYADVRTAAEEMVGLDSSHITPNPVHHATYSRLYKEVYRPLFPTLQTALQRLAALS